MVESKRDVAVLKEEMRRILNNNNYAIEELEEIKKEIRAGADPITEVQQGMTPFYLAIGCNDVAFASEILGIVDEKQKQALLTAKDENDCTVLHGAAYRGCIEAMAFILDHVNNPQSFLLERDSEGYTPLDAASDGMNDKAVEYIINFAEDPQALLMATDDEGLNALHFILERLSALVEDEGIDNLSPTLMDKGEAIIRMFLDKSSDSEALLMSRTNDLNSVLHYAAEINSQKIIQMLLEKTQDTQILITTQNNVRETALHVAAFEGANAVVDAFLTLVPDFNALLALQDNAGNTGLHVVLHNLCGRDNMALSEEVNDDLTIENVAEYICVLADGVDNFPELLSIKNDEGNNVLHVVAESGNILPMYFLLNQVVETAALLTSSNNQENTPLHIAASYGNSDMADLLAGCGLNPFLKNKDGKTARDLTQPESAIHSTMQEIEGNYQGKLNEIQASSTLSYGVLSLKYRAACAVAGHEIPLSNEVIVHEAQEAVDLVSPCSPEIAESFERSKAHTTAKVVGQSWQKYIAQRDEMSQSTAAPAV